MYDTVKSLVPWSLVLFCCLHPFYIATTAALRLQNRTIQRGQDTRRAIGDEKRRERDNRAHDNGFVSRRIICNPRTHNAKKTPAVRRGRDPLRSLKVLSGGETVSRP